MNKKIAIVAALITVIAGIFLFLNFNAQNNPAPITPTPQAIIETPPPAEPVAEPQASVVEPLPVQPLPIINPIVAAPTDLDDSDATVSEAIMELAAELAPMVASDEQIRKWVLAIDNLAKGELISKHQPWNYSMGSFKAAGDGDVMLLSEDNYQRAQPLLEIGLAIPPKRLTLYYQNWQPLFEKAYGEQGNMVSFDSRINLMMDNILAVKPLTAPAVLERKSVMYTFKDPALENASDIEKLMWRLGPNNSARIQAYIRQLQTELKSQ